MVAVFSSAMPCTWATRGRGRPLCVRLYEGSLHVHIVLPHSYYGSLTRRGHSFVPAQVTLTSSRPWSKRMRSSARCVTNLLVLVLVVSVPNSFSATQLTLDSCLVRHNAAAVCSAHSISLVRPSKGRQPWVRSVWPVTTTWCGYLVTYYRSISPAATSQRRMVRPTRKPTSRRRLHLQCSSSLRPCSLAVICSLEQCGTIL